ncbi:MAG: hypothetical protein QY310_11175 [Candidatus Jettenia sp. CY-1]|nr:MAG: hypothetical protein QY310_11175 [Candidatus Jettenia sp. CY-1]
MYNHTLFASKKWEKEGLKLNNDKEIMYGTIPYTTALPSVLIAIVNRNGKDDLLECPA